MTILKPSNITPLALTMGDPSGIGLDLTITAWTMRDELNLPAFIYIGDIHVLAARAHALDIDIEVTECQPEEAAHHFATSIPALHIPCPHSAV
jgi:4-hydroxythreonine-4-phosphate dehydrogenase